MLFPAPPHLTEPPSKFLTWRTGAYKAGPGRWAPPTDLSTHSLGHHLRTLAPPPSGEVEWSSPLLGPE